MPAPGLMTKIVSPIRKENERKEDRGTIAFLEVKKRRTLRISQPLRKGKQKQKKGAFLD